MTAVIIILRMGFWVGDGDILKKFLIK